MRYTLPINETFIPLTKQYTNTSPSAIRLKVTSRLANNFFSRLLGVKNTYIELNQDQKKVFINFNKASDSISKTLKPFVSEKWKAQESEVYIPALINKEIDAVANKYQRNITTAQKDKIRANVLRRGDLMSKFKNIKNLNSAAQTSIGQTTATHLLHNKSLQFLFKTANLSRETQSEINAAISNKISDQVYQRFMHENVSHLRKITTQESINILYTSKR